ncbi:helix-turn-helix domain-containing protein [Clostridium tyrobutyricum]|uniref:helix-turn-helix domain-containing protein n=1 Tax=Clostridium tyrobutyricum TaxID=1519 RepID=UPI0011CC14DB|nr:helix-turn-helix transcriptional regulator [Clostridium tyrobutyricum]
MTILGENIKKLRERAGYSIRKLSELSDVSKSVISEIEGGKSKNPRYETINKIAAALNVKPEVLAEMEYEYEYAITDVKEAFEIILSQDNLTINGSKLTGEAKSQLINSIKMTLKFVEEVQKNTETKEE